MSYPFDAEPGESEDEYNRRVEAESKSAVASMMMIAGFAFAALKLGIIYCFFLYAAFRSVSHIWGKDISTWKMVGLTFIITYFMLCIIYFLKGIMLGLRANKNGWWKILCMLITCVPPVIITYTLVLLPFSMHGQQLLIVRIMAWGIGLFIGFYTYNIYKFLTPGAPHIFYWGFVAGRRLVKPN